MFRKTTFISTFIGTVVYYLIGHFFYAHLAIHFFHKHILIEANKSFNAFFIILGGFVISYVMSVIYQRWTSKYGFSSGFIFGMWMGFFIGYGAGFVFYGGYAMILDLKAQLVDSVWNVLFLGLVGGVIGAVIKKLSKFNYTQSIN
ncbi:MAG: hypothetical protein VW080_01475 [Flavobacteriaceae bacterium]